MLEKNIDVNHIQKEDRERFLDVCKQKIFQANPLKK